MQQVPKVHFDKKIFLLKKKQFSDMLNCNTTYNIDNLCLIKGKNIKTAQNLPTFFCL